MEGYDPAGNVPTAIGGRQSTAVRIRPDSVRKLVTPLPKHPFRCACTYPLAA